MKVLVLGAGKMIEAILVGLSATEDLSTWSIFSPSGKSAQELAQKVGAKSTSDLKSIETPDYVIVGCKPQQLKELKKTLNGKFKSATYVSILAAILEQDQRDILEVKKLIRVMPNLPVRYQQGVSLICSESAPNELRIFQSLFHQLGMAIIVEEKELEELTLLTGSGPAFFYEFTQTLAHSFQSLTIEERENLASLVLLGAATQVSKQHQSLSEMTSAVTSKGGVTIAVLEKWRELKFAALLTEGVKAGKNRAQELRDLFK